MNRDWRLTYGFSIGALVWCVGAGLLLWFLPAGSSSSSSSSGVTTVGTQSFASVSAFGPLPLFIPVVLAGIAAWSAWRHHRPVLVIASALSTVFAVLTGFSIGLAYLPAVGALVVASAVAPSRRQTPGSVGGPRQFGR